MYRIRLESTFGLAMMETWEKVLICTHIISLFSLHLILTQTFIDGAFLSITLLFWLSFFTYYPGHLAYLSRRFSYYVFEDESVDVGLMVREWLAEQARRGWQRFKAVGGADGSRASMAEL